MSVGHPQPRHEFMIPTEVARLLRVDSSTLRRWAKAGAANRSGKPVLMPAFTTPGGHYRYRVADVYAYLDGQMNSMTEPDREVEAEDKEEEN